MPRILIIADDLTGANDSAVQFAERGYRAATMLCSEDAARGPLIDAQVLAVSTESRNVSPDTAARLVGRIVPSLIEGFSPDIVIKKIDSTLRGNPGIETSAVARLLGIPVVVAPAYPQNGRTVRDGYLLVDGKMLSETYAAIDALAPVRSSHVADHFAMLADFTVADATSQEDLESLVRSHKSAGRRVLWVGSAGLAKAVAASEPVAAIPETRGPLRGRTLVLFGSLHPTAIAQVDALYGLPDCAVIRPSSDADLPMVPKTVERSGEHAVVVATDRVAFDGNDPQRAAAAMRGFFAGLASKAIASREFGNMVISGGDVAYAVLRSLGARGMNIHSEVLPGVAFGSVIGGQAGGMGVVTKAGGFGNDSTLRHIIAWLRQ